VISLPLTPKYVPIGTAIDKNILNQKCGLLARTSQLIPKKFADFVSSYYFHILLSILIT